MSNVLNSLQNSTGPFKKEAVEPPIDPILASFSARRAVGPDLIRGKNTTIFGL